MRALPGSPKTVNFTAHAPDGEWRSLRPAKVYFFFSIITFDTVAGQAI